MLKRATCGHGLAQWPGHQAAHLPPAPPPPLAPCAVITGVQIHNWANNFEDDSPNLEFVAPTAAYVVVNGVKTHIDLNAVPVSLDRQCFSVGSLEHWLRCMRCFAEHGQATQLTPCSCLAIPRAAPDPAPDPPAQRHPGAERQPGRLWCADGGVPRLQLRLQGRAPRAEGAPAAVSCGRAEACCPANRRAALCVLLGAWELAVKLPSVQWTRLQRSIASACSPVLTAHDLCTSSYQVHAHSEGRRPGELCRPDHAHLAGAHCRG